MRIIVMGATSGIGYAVAEMYLKAGHTVGLCGRRTENLQPLFAAYPDSAYTAKVDVTDGDAPSVLHGLVGEMGGMDLYLHCSGYGKQTPQLDSEVEMQTVNTNAMGFTRMIDAAYRYFADNGLEGQIAFISSIAGTKGLGASPSYSATKRFQWIYAEALCQMAKMNGYRITLTDIRPGFVATPFLGNDKYPFMLQTEYVARRIVKAVARKKRVAVIDWRYALLCVLWRLVPSWLWVRLVVRTKTFK